ncbi:hypothetical protein GCM10027428_23680 [Haliea atlantica]
MLTTVAYLGLACCFIGVAVYCMRRVRRSRLGEERACVTDASAEPMDFERIPRSLIHPHQSISEKKAKKRRRWL